MTDTLNSTAPINPTETPPAQEGEAPSAFMQSMRAGIEEARQTQTKQPEQAPAAEPAKEQPKAAEPAKAETKVEAKVEPVDDLPENITGAKAADWKRVKQRLEESETKAKKIESQHKAVADELAALKAKPGADPEQLKALAKERDEYAEIMKIVAIEREPRFQKYFNGEFDRITNQLKEVAGDKLKQALSIAKAEPGEWRDNQLDSLLEGIESQGKKLRITNLLNEWDTVRSKREGEIANASQSYEKLQEQKKFEAAEQQKRTMAVREAAVQRALEMARNYDAFKTKDGDTAHNEIVKNREAAVTKFLMGQVDEKTFMEAPILAAEASRLKTVVKALTEERDELVKTVKGYQKGNPSPRGDTSPNGQPAADGEVATAYGPSRFLGSFNKGMSEVRSR